MPPANKESENFLHPDPARLLLDHVSLFARDAMKGPILDLASGGGQNGVFLAEKGLFVVCADKSPASLEQVRILAEKRGVTVSCWEVDLEGPGVNPLPVNHYGGIIVFRYLHRPLIKCIKKALKEGGILLYETFTRDQPFFGKPHNPDYLLEPDELRTWFREWKILYYFEGIRDDPPRAVAQLVCKKENIILP